MHLAQCPGAHVAKVLQCRVVGSRQRQVRRWQIAGKTLLRLRRARQVRKTIFLPLWACTRCTCARVRRHLQTRGCFRDGSSSGRAEGRSSREACVCCTAPLPHAECQTGACRHRNWIRQCLVAESRRRRNAYLAESPQDRGTGQ